MNNLNTIGQYLSSLQQNIALLARGLADIKAEVEAIKQQPTPDTDNSSNAPVNVDVSDMRREFELFKMEVNKKLGKIEELDSSIESIFSSLQSSLPFQVTPSIEVPEPVSNPDDNLNCNIDDIEIIAKKSPAPKKKTTKKT